MPNWVKNNVCVIGKKEDVNLFAERHLKHDEDGFDFETIIPMPENIYRGSLGAEEYKKYGQDNWYDWSIKNWGTKWGSKDTYVDGITEYSDNTAELRFSFDTAWSCPEAIYVELGKLYSNLNFEIEFADEDIGHNCGSITIQDGSTQIDYNNDEEFARDVWGYSEETEEDIQ